MTETLLETIATQGILGILLVLALTGGCFLFNLYRKEKDARIQDLKTILEAGDKEKVESKVTLDRILELLRSKK